jgi:hypothetical protein
MSQAVAAQLREVQAILGCCLLGCQQQLAAMPRDAAAAAIAGLGRGLDGLLPALVQEVRACMFFVQLHVPAVSGCASVFVLYSVSRV